MKSSGGNYVQWSVAQIVSGAVCAGLTLMKVPFLPTLGASLLVLVLYKLLYKWEHRATEADMQSMLRVFSLSSLATLAVLTITGKWLHDNWINALWSIALASRGFFGLIVFACGTRGSGAKAGREGSE
ncbi:MAG: hypothetical protein R6V62_05615 [Candidatus Fermentibacteraceae bacterium]